MGAFVQELFSLSLYKRSQGRMARQATFGALAVIMALAAWGLHNHYKVVDFSRSAATSTAPADDKATDGTTTTTTGAADAATSPGAKKDEKRTAQFVYVYMIPLVVLAGGLWVSFRIVQFPPFADFLISVEGEMNKVTWPARSELLRASAVVMFVIFFLAFILFAYDLALAEIMKGIEWSLNQVRRIFGG